MFLINVKILFNYLALDDDDNGRVKENCISEINIDQAGCFRHFIPNGHMSPFTMTYLGINDKPIGIRA